MKKFRTKQVAEALNVTDRTVRYYAEMGFCDVTPGGKGRGKVTLFSEKDVLSLFFVRQLAEHGIKIDTIKYILDNLRGQGAFLADGIGKKIVANDFTNPKKQWVDFLNVDDVQSESHRVYVMILDATTEYPNVFFQIIEDKDKSAILSVSDMKYSKMKYYSDCLVIDLVKLSELVKKL